MAAKPPSSGPSRYFLAGGYAALVAGFVIAGIIPCARGINAANRGIQQDQAEIESRIAKTRELADINAQVDVIKLETRDFDRLVPPNQDFGAFLQDLSKQLDEAGLTDVTYKNDTVSSVGRSQRLPIEVRGRGTYAQFHDFLLRLEKLQRLSSVGRLSIESESDMTGNVNVTLTLYIYNAKPAS